MRLEIKKGSGMDIGLFELHLNEEMVMDRVEDIETIKEKINKLIDAWFKGGD